MNFECGGSDIRTLRVTLAPGNVGEGDAYRELVAGSHVQVIQTGVENMAAIVLQCQLAISYRPSLQYVHKIADPAIAVFWCYKTQEVAQQKFFAFCSE